jgi:hypothetical protein
MKMLITRPNVNEKIKKAEYEKYEYELQNLESSAVQKEPPPCCRHLPASR